MNKKFNEMFDLATELSDKELAEKMQKEIEAAHDCPECHGKMVCILIDNLGNTYCAYCNKQVNYPKPSLEFIEKMRRLSQC